MPLQASLTIYYGTRWFLLCAPDFVLERRAHPYRRLSATLLVATAAPFTLQIAGQAPQQLQACLVAPGVTRERIAAIGSHIRIFDLPIETAYFAPLQAVLEGKDWVEVAPATLAPLAQRLEALGRGDTSCDALHRLLHDVVLAMSGQPPHPRQIDPRIAMAVERINSEGGSTLEHLAAAAQLSQSRFRQLFKHELDCTLRHYQRWAAVWRAVWLWQRGVTWTDIAHQCGFFDLSHLDRAFLEVFGLNPSTVVDPTLVRLHRCEP